MTTIICTKCDRLGRSVLDLCQIAKEIEEAGADLVFLEQGIDTSNPTGKMMFQIL
ncbi:MAG: recombinase family protein, partial [Limisphaerales bacterium]